MLNGESLWVLCVLLFVDGATFAFATTPLLLHYGHEHEPWKVALAGGAASALGSMTQLLILRWLLGSQQPWMRRFTPSRDRVEAALKSYPSASFLLLAVARATPLPDAPLKLVAAVIGYSVLLYGLAIFLGSLPYYFALAVVGSKVKIPITLLIAASALVAVGILIDRLRRRRKRRAS